MKSQTFNTLYKELNSEQKHAVDWIEGPVMVIAGPGTGKTQILTLRIANILKKADTKPENILALTFTESGVFSMRKRLAEIIGSPAYSVIINTFHGFCNDIIKQYPEEFPRIIGSNNITEVDQIKILEDVIEILSLKILKPFGDTFYYLKPILRSINNLKREGISPKEFSNIVVQEKKNFHDRDDLHHVKGAYKGRMKGEHQKRLRSIEKNEELLLVYDAYQKKLSKLRFYDYTDMIMEVLEAFSKNKDLLLILQEQHQYILVDEHQDTNNAQNKILELLLNYHTNPNIFVVGDEKQAIFRFQGASLENFMYFKSLYPKAELIYLEKNYRSTQTILDSAHSLIASEKKLSACATHPETEISLAEFSSTETELYFVGRAIHNNLEDGVEPQNIAVLYRDNKDAFPLAELLEKMGVPFSVESDQDILEDNDIKKLRLILRAIHNFGSNESFFLALHIDFLSIEPLDIYKIISYSNENKKTGLEVARSRKILQALELESYVRIHDFYLKLASWVSYEKNHNLLDLLGVVIRESGLLSYLLREEGSKDKLAKLRGFFNEAKSLIEKHKDYGLTEFLEYLETLEAYRITVAKSLAGYSGNRVRLMTAHKSKGLEFDYVYIVGAVNGHWGNRRVANLLPLPSNIFSLVSDTIEEGTALDDERRLFYVALTRARKGVTISWFTKDKNGRDTLGSQFIEELRKDRVQLLDTKKYEEDHDAQKDLIYAPPQVIGPDIGDLDYIKELFLRNGLSVTGLNNYLECPWKYFYTNLIRIPQAPSKHQLYGIAVHAALKDFFESRKERDVGSSFLTETFGDYLTKQPLTKHDYEDVLTKGTLALAGYYETYHETWITHTLSEFIVNGVMLSDNIRIRGKIDKLEFLDDDSNKVIVVDYKTGRPKTRGYIKGSTKNSRGDIKRQLVFYNLLLANHDNGRFNMVAGDIDFVEPEKNGAYRKERFEIQKEEVGELEELVKDVGTQILTLSFWDKRCENSVCQFCKLRELM